MIPEVTTPPNLWQALWRQWYTMGKGPFTWSHGSSLGPGRHCFFCDSKCPDHAQDCIYVRAESHAESHNDFWHTLWQELTASSPWDRTGFCHYCGVPAPGVHDPSCAYHRAKRLLDAEAKSQPDPWRRLCQFWKTALTSLETYGGESESNPKESTK